VCQTLISGMMQEPDASVLEHGSELDEQIMRLQCLVSYLLEKNEELRQRLATGLRKGEQWFTGQRS
jgi:hypothetical protein